MRRVSLYRRAGQRWRGSRGLTWSGSGGRRVAGVGRRCRQAGVPCIAFAGGVADDLGDFGAAGVDAVMSVVPRPMAMEEAMERPAERIADGVERGLRVFAAGLAASRREAAE